MPKLQQHPDYHEGFYDALDGMPGPYYRDNHGSGEDHLKPRVVRDLRDGVPDGPDVIREVLAVAKSNEFADLIVAALNRAGN